jgi:hypothetical protein
MSMPDVRKVRGDSLTRKMMLEVSILNLRIRAISNEIHAQENLIRYHTRRGALAGQSVQTHGFAC